MLTRSNLRFYIVIMTVVTAAIHLLIGAGSLGVPEMRTLSILWLLNGVGYLVLLFAGFARWALIPVPRTVSQPALAVFAGVTIVAWLLMSGVLKGEPPGLLAIIDKIVEVFLIAAMVMYLRAKKD